jgi:hypothetical protein
VVIMGVTKAMGRDDLAPQFDLPPSVTRMDNGSGIYLHSCTKVNTKLAVCLLFDPRLNPSCRVLATKTSLSK